MKSILFPLLISICAVLLTFGMFHTMEDYFSETLNILSQYPLQFGLVSFLVLVSDIVLPVPSSIVLYLNGYFLGIIPGAMVSISGLMIGSIIGYYIGKFSSTLFHSNRNQKSQQILSKYGPSAIILTRGIPILSESVCIVCGYNNLGLKKYILFNFVGYLPVCLMHAYFGSLGIEGNNAFLISFTCSIAISICFWFFGKKILSRYVEFSS